MKQLIFLAVFPGLFGFGCQSAVQVEQTENPSITLKKGTSAEKKGREQLQRLVSEYDLESWMFTRKVVIESHAIPHSHPVLTINTRHLDDDLMQLSTFLHEEIHWFLDDREEATNRAVDSLRRMFPNPPEHGVIGTRSEQSTYRHLIVNWLELDAMTRLVGKERARSVLSRKDYYDWIYARVLDQTEEIEGVLVEQKLVILPGGT